MSRTHRRIFAVACILILAGCQSQGPAQRTGEALDRAGSRTGEALGRAADDTGAALNRTGDWIRNRTQ